MTDMREGRKEKRDMNVERDVDHALD